MADTLCIFEDPQYVKLLPLAYTRPVFDLRCGILTLREKIQRCYPKANVALLCRPYLADVVKQENPQMLVNEVPATNCLMVNGRVLADAAFAKKVTFKGKDAMYLSGNTVVAVRLNAGRLSAGHDFSDVFDPDHFGELEKIHVDVHLIEYPWDLVNRNGEQIVSDFASLVTRGAKKMKGTVHAGVHLLNKKNIFIDSGSIIKPGCVLDAANGPIYIGKNVKIFPNAVIEGPVCVGANSIIKIGAKIYENTSIGELCKVGGEVEVSIIHSHSNKQHDGFLGHSYLGSWCNLGADTNTSDLKNNYGSVKVILNGTEVDTGSQFVGLTMGDHSKSGINTMFNTGTIVGVSTNLFGAGFPPKYVPSFSWGGSEKLVQYELAKAIDVARRVMERRKVQMTEVDKELLGRVFELTRSERVKS